MKFLFDILLILFSLVLKITVIMTPLEVNIGTDQKNKDKESKQVLQPRFQSPILWMPFLKCFHMGRRNNQNENKKIVICGMK